jgi:hypothetical protein
MILSALAEMEQNPDNMISNSLWPLDGANERWDRSDGEEETCPYGGILRELDTCEMRRPAFFSKE